MRKNIYIITLFNDKQFISCDINSLTNQLNEYFETNNLIDTNNNIYHLDFYKLKSRIYKFTKTSYPFKNIERMQLEDYIKEDIDRLYPNYHEKTQKTQRKYIDLILKAKNIKID